MAGDWQGMILHEARREADELVEQAERTVREYVEHGLGQAYEDALIALTARIKAMPEGVRLYVLAAVLGDLAWTLSEPIR
jgi:hypothetical protein